MRFLARLKGDLAFTVPQDIANIQMEFLQGVINLLLQGLCQSLAAGRRWVTHSPSLFWG